MSKIKETFLDDIETIIINHCNLVSLSTLLKDLKGKWNLTNDEHTADLLENFGFGVSNLNDEYYIIIPRL